MTFEKWFNQMVQHWPGAEAMREAFRQSYMLGYTHGWDDGESLVKDINDDA
jgi:hypothetical protein